MNPCNICQSPTINKCSNCKQAFYCSAAHQKQDWKSHKANCQPFKVESNETLGRYLVTTRNIKPFEILLKEAPLVSAPSQITLPVCLGCLNGIEENNYIKCDKCGWPLCGEECNDKPEHKAECEFTAKIAEKINIDDFKNPNALYESLGTIRCLMLRKANPEKWTLFNQLESLENQRRGSVQWKADLESIGKFIPKFYNSTEFSEDEIMRTVGILQINGHEVPSTDPSHMSVFYKASMFEHSCLPNVAKTFTKNGHIVLWAPRAIKKGTHLSICYSDAIWGTLHRQRHLMHTKLFKCRCERCDDVTECGTHYSSLKCMDSSCFGNVEAIDSKSWNEDWQCYLCKKPVDIVYVNEIMEKSVKDKLSTENTMEKCYRYLEKYAKLLPSQHFNMCEVKIQLVQLIGKDAKELMLISDDQLAMKLKIAKELIELYEILAPCEIRLLGMLCFDMHSAIAENTRRISLKANMSSKESLEESLMYADKCIDYLQYESDIFIEGHILKQAKINRDALKMVLRAI